MFVRKSKYERLLKENAKLKRDIYYLLMEPKSFRADKARIEHGFNHAANEAWFFPSREEYKKYMDAKAAE